MATIRSTEKFRTTPRVHVLGALEIHII
jgi:hypothetical protein